MFLAREHSLLGYYFDPVYVRSRGLGWFVEGRRKQADRLSRAPGVKKEFS